MFATRTIIPFIDPHCSGHISDHFRKLFGQLHVDFDGERGSTLNIQASSIDDWLFCKVEGRGETVVSTDQQALRLANHALLTMPLRGNNRSLQQPGLMKGPDRMVLNQWPAADAIMSSGDFSYLCAYVPRAALETLADGDVPYGQSIEMGSGPGAVIGCALVSLSSEAFQGRQSKAISALLPDFLRMTLTSFGSTACSSGPRLSSRYVRAMRYLHAHFTDPDLTPTQVSSACGVSVRQLYREFRQQESSFETRLRQLRLQHACSLLASRPQDKISEIAYESGFRNAIVFSRVFRQTYRQTPSEFRNAGSAMVSTRN